MGDRPEGPISGFLNGYTYRHYTRRRKQLGLRLSEGNKRELVNHSGVLPLRSLCFSVLEFFPEDLLDIFRILVEGLDYSSSLKGLERKACFYIGDLLDHATDPKREEPLEAGKEDRVVWYYVFRSPYKETDVFLGFS